MTHKISEIVDKWLHSTENGQSIIDKIINDKDIGIILGGIALGVLIRHISAFREVEPSIENNSDSLSAICNGLNEYFTMHGYPFEAYGGGLYVHITKKRQTNYCFMHKTFIKTEYDLIEHRECLKEPYKSTTSMEETSNNIVIDEMREPEEIRQKRIEQEKKLIKEM